jgi:ParB/RepB/Spo0J family partition protein
MTIREFPVSNIKPNPYQPRIEEDPQKEAELLESVKVSGIIQVPDGRLDPHDPNVAQLRCGHRRLAAWRKAFPGKPFRIDIKELTDLEMSDGGIRENNDRNNLSAIEKMRAIKRRMKDFGMTELQAGAPLHLKTPSAVSNLLRLGHLPEKTQLLVHRGQLPERYARGLVLFSRMDPKAVDQGAVKIAGAEDETRRDYAYRNYMRNYLQTHGVYIYMNSWPMSWPGKSIIIDPLKHPKETPKEIPACTGCPWLFDRKEFSKYCLRPACHSAKTRLWKQKREKQLERTHSKLKTEPFIKPDPKKKEKPDPKIAYAVEADRLIKIAVVSLAPIIPNNLVDFLREPILGGWIDPKWKQAGLPERKRMLMADLLDNSDLIPHNSWDSGKPAKTIAAIAALARKLQVRMPKGWYEPPLLKDKNIDHLRDLATKRGHIPVTQKRGKKKRK